MAPEQKNIIITGAGGLIGPLIAERLLCDRGYKVVLTDLLDPVVPERAKYPENATCIKGDITDPELVKSVIAAAQPLHAIYIFHGVMTAKSEGNFDLSLKVNFDSVRNIVLTLRETNPGVRVFYASSQAVYGQPLPAVITDDVTAIPQGTYGSHKLMCEMLINDMHRKGFIDAFVLRFPTVAVRPGSHLGAGSSFLSGIIREPMNGQECIVPIEDRSFRNFMSSPRLLQDNLVRLLDVDSNQLPQNLRHFNFPGVSCSIQELMDALAKYGGEDKLKFIKEKEDPTYAPLLRGWPRNFDLSTALRLGLKVHESPEELVKEYIDSLH